MNAPAQTLYRPTLHQIRVFDREQVDSQMLLTVVRDAVEHIAHILAPEDAEALRSQVAPDRPLHLPPRQARYPLVRSTALYPVPGRTPLKAALLAYQEGTSLLLHCTWHWDGEGNAETVRLFLTQRWPGGAALQSHDRGESLLLTAVPTDGKACEASYARPLFAHLVPPEAAAIPLQDLVLDGATLYVQQWLLPRQAPWPALVLFHDRDTEASPAADRLATVDWPLIALYHLRLEHYAQEYRERVAPALEQRLVAMRDTLKAVFTPPGQQPLAHVLTTPDPHRLQRALVCLAQPQYALLDTLGAAENAQHHVRRELENLQQRLAHLPLVAVPGTLAPVATTDRLQATLAGRARQALRQIEADVAQVKHQAEQRTARAMEVLRTRNDILSTLYDKQRNWLIGLVGIFLALAQVLDKEVARVLYTYGGVERVWLFLGGTPVAWSQNPDDPRLFYIRLGIIVGLTLVLAMLMGVGTRLLQRWKAR